jgi:hypothetical protein
MAVGVATAGGAAYLVAKPKAVATKPLLALSGNALSALMKAGPMTTPAPVQPASIAYCQVARDFYNKGRKAEGDFAAAMCVKAGGTVPA